MKIAQVAPLYESVPPRLYGGTERVVHYLTEELVARGHEVTLFASGDSLSSARLIAPHSTSLRMDEDCMDTLAPHIYMMEMVEQRAHQYDIIHSHIDYLFYPLIRRSQSSYLTTLHGRLDIPELLPVYKTYQELPLVSISDAQRRPVPFANWQATIYHGMPAGLFQCNSQPGHYLLFMGRISKEKRVDRAIQVAIQAGIPLKIAAKVDKVDREYFEKEIRPLLDHPLVEMLGEVNGRAKNELLENAMGLLFLIDWPEPFGLVMIEAMACGTPVIAYPGGSVPEVIDHGVTGFIVHSQQEAVKAVERLPQISRRHCRVVFEQRFSASRMADDYLAVYERIIRQGQHRQRARQINGQSLNKTSIYGATTSRE